MAKRYTFFLYRKFCGYVNSNTFSFDIFHSLITIRPITWNIVNSKTPRRFYEISVLILYVMIFAMLVISITDSLEIWQFVSVLSVFALLSGTYGVIDWARWGNSLHILLLVIWSGAPYKHGLTLIPAWINNYTYYKVWDEISYPFPNFNGYTVTIEVWEWICNFIPHFTGHVITHPW